MFNQVSSIFRKTLLFYSSPTNAIAHLYLMMIFSWELAVVAILLILRYFISKSYERILLINLIGAFKLWLSMHLFYINLAESICSLFSIHKIASFNTVSLILYYSSYLFNNSSNKPFFFLDYDTNKLTFEIAVLNSKAIS